MSDETKTDLDNSDAIHMLLQRFDEYMDGIENIVSEYGNDAVNLGLNALRVDALSDALTHFFFFVILYGIIFFIYKKTKNNEQPGTVVLSSDIDQRVKAALSKPFGDRSDNEDSLIEEKLNIPSVDIPAIRNLDDSADDVVLDLASQSDLTIIRKYVVPAAAFGGALLFFLKLNIWNYVGIFYPELYAIYKFAL